jgi:hypothetical protein
MPKKRTKSAGANRAFDAISHHIVIFYTFVEKSSVGNLTKHHCLL